MSRINIEGPAIVVIPGSHGKFIYINKENKINSCMTTLSGELISVITRNTIIADSLDSSFAGEIDKAMILRGASLSKKIGLNRSSFSIRILERFTDANQNERANILLGIVLYEDLRAVLKSSYYSKDLKVYICGKDMLKDALTLIFEEDGSFGNVYTVESEILEDLSGYGALCIMEKQKKRGFKVLNH